MESKLSPTDLNQFIGTEQYYKYYTILLTDGVKYFADEAGAYWFLDIVFTEIATSEEPFITVEMTVKDGKATIKAHDGDYKYQAPGQTP